jgi:hypothetical protein
MMMVKAIKKVIMFLSILFLLSFIVYSADIISEMTLENYPYLFINNDRLDVSFVVGEFALSQDVLSTVDIASSLQDELKEVVETRGSSLFELDVVGGDLEKELTRLYMDVFEKKTTSAASTILDTSLNVESLKDKNLIVIGGPCVNWVSAHFYNNPENCADGFTAGRGHIRLFRNGKGIVMIVAGYSAEDTMNTANILANYKDYSANFVGTSLRVSSAWISQLRIEELKTESVD